MTSLNIDESQEISSNLQIKSLVNNTRYTVSRVHNKRREGEYPTSIPLPNTLRKVMT